MADNDERQIQEDSYNNNMSIDRIMGDLKSESASPKSFESEEPKVPKEKDLVIDRLYDKPNKKLIPEDDDRGNIEYKRRLDKKDKRGLSTMVMQMLTRMTRGHMETGVYDAHYILGVDDDGTFSNLKKGEVLHTSQILRAVIASASAKIVSEKIYEFTDKDSKPAFVMHVHIKKDFQIDHIPESNVYLMGPTGVSKTSILSHLVHGQIDNAQGLSRELSLRHAHERQSGVTSSSKYDTIGSDGDSIVNYDISLSYDMEAICEESNILFNVVDLPGDFRYSKTISHSLLTMLPELIMVCIPIVDPLDYIEDNYEIYSMIFQICLMFDIQPLIVLTKSDLVSQDKWDSIRKEVVKYLSSLFRELKLDHNNIETIVVTNVSNDGIDPLKEYLVNFGSDVLDSLDDAEESTDSGSNSLLFRFNDAFEIPNTGTIYHGIMNRGTFHAGETVSVICNGKIMERKIVSIHRKSMDVDQLNEGETGSIMISGKCDRSTVDKTAVITNANGVHHLTSTGYLTTVAEDHIRPKQYLLFVGNNIITVKVEETDNPDVYSFKTHNSTEIIIDVDDQESVPGILRDERKQLTFVRIMRYNSSKSEDIFDSVHSDSESSLEVDFDSNGLW